MSDSAAELVRVLRSHGTDLRRVEAKAAAGGLPRSVRETLSAFSNGTGGTILLGLDERAGFAVVPELDVVRLRDCLDAMCADELTPPVRAEIDIEEVEGHQIVVARVPEHDPRHKPCYVKAKGEYAGSYVRGGDGDRRMSEYEIALLHANRGQPSDDREPVRGARLDDLDVTAVQKLLARLRDREPGAFAALPDEHALRRVGVLVQNSDPDDDRPVPSLGGLLALGQYPQQFFPQLNLTFIVIPATSKDTIPADGPRFLDNRALGGPIPVMVNEAVSAVVRNMATRAHVSGVGRHDTYEYPVEALREAITNALMHRDYSPYSRGTQVQVEMYSDRLVVRNPGGLFGTVTEDDLGAEGVSSSRNGVLARLLQDVALPGTDQVVCENRGTGIPAMIQSLRRAGLATPLFDDALTRFRVTIPKHALLDAETLAVVSEPGPRAPRGDRIAEFDALFDTGKTLTIGDVTAATGLKNAMAARYLARLVDSGRIVPTAPPRSRKRAYRRV